MLPSVCMTAVCPRCRAPLYGPVCQVCGAQASAFGAQAAPQGQPPPYGYGQPMPYGMPYGVPYRAPPAGKKMAVAGGILALVGSGLVILFAAMALGNHDVTDQKAASGFLIAAIVLALASAVPAVLAMRGSWVGSMLAGILQTLDMFTALMCVGAIASAKDRLKLQDLFSFNDDGVDPDRIKALETLSGLMVLGVLVTLIAAIFCYIGIASARRWKRTSTPMQATDVF